ncbi:MAG TPA: nucleotidyltransferase domain-containing protein [Longimicrobium sp.]|jgi:predicted nucleotidyltransferase
MQPTQTDTAIATQLAQRIVAAGLGRVRRVVMIGSRARGVAHPTSDLDLVVLVEVPRGSRAWGPAENLAERDRIQQAVGVPPITTDLSVRTTDHYHEARHVIGGVEHLVDLEGVDVFSQPLSDPPSIRRSPTQVRLQHTGTWITHAAAVLEEATSSEKADSAGTPEGAARLASAAHASVMRAVTALLVSHQLHSAKRDGIPAMLKQLAGVDPETAAELEAVLRRAGPPFPTACAVLRMVVLRLGSGPGMAPYLNQAQVWLKTAEPGRVPSSQRPSLARG